jgi:hypothetical protein
MVSKNNRANQRNRSHYKQITTSWSQAVMWSTPTLSYLLFGWSNNRRLQKTVAYPNLVAVRRRRFSGIIAPNGISTTLANWSDQFIIGVAPQLGKA